MTNIHIANTLTQEQIVEIDKIEKQCHIYDRTKGKLYLSNELNFYEKMPCFFLLYEEARLLGVLSVFAPMASTAEISALVLPGYRRKGHFKAMFLAA